MVAVENALCAFSKERWARSWRPRLRQLPQAASHMLAPNDRVTFVEPREKDITEVNRPNAIVHFFESDGVRCERVTDEEQALNRNVPAFVMRFTRKWPGYSIGDNRASYERDDGR